MKLSDEDVLNELTFQLGRAREVSYTGYDKFDALNSPFLSALAFNNKYLRFLYQQVVKESPINYRGLLGVPKERNPKGIALFVITYLDLYNLSKNAAHLAEAETLLSWLIVNRSPGFKNYCWGYNFVWETLNYMQNKHEPNAVVTCFVTEALIKAYGVTKKEQYLEVAKSAGSFLTNDLATIAEDEQTLSKSYFIQPTPKAVINIQSFVGAVLIKLWQLTGNEEWKLKSDKLYNLVLSSKTDYNAWYYTYPHKGTLRGIDNYHTGFVLDSILDRLHAAPTDALTEAYNKGLVFYRNELFEANGAPKWEYKTTYPRDIHSCAQGIITFSKAYAHTGKAEHKEFAGQVLQWTIANMKSPASGLFIYRKSLLFNWNVNYMRWCTAWMCKAMAEYINVGKV